MYWYNYTMNAQNNNYSNEGVWLGWCMYSKRVGHSNKRHCGIPAISPHTLDYVEPAEGDSWFGGVSTEKLECCQDPKEAENGVQLCRVLEAEGQVDVVMPAGHIALVAHG